MADPRFYKNRGPFTLAAICDAAGIACPPDADPRRAVADLAGLEGAGAQHLTFLAGSGRRTDSFALSRAGVCLVPAAKMPPAPEGMVLLPCADVGAAWIAAAALFYPDIDEPVGAEGVDPGAVLGAGVELGPHVSIGPGAEIGAGTRIGAGSVIGPGVTIGQRGRIGAHCSIVRAHIGDGVEIAAGARIGQPGFGFASSARGHRRLPQLGRVILQDHVAVGAGTAIDRGALGDTVVGEGTKIDNLVQIGHNVQIGRHCIITSQVGIAGSAVLEDFVVLGGQAGIGDHVRIGAGARLGGQAGVPSGLVLKGNQDYSGFPAKPVREWAREILALARLARRRKQDEP